MTECGTKSTATTAAKDIIRRCDATNEWMNESKIQNDKRTIHRVEWMCIHDGGKVRCYYYLQRPLLRYGRFRFITRPIYSFIWHNFFWLGSRNAYEIRLKRQKECQKSVHVSVRSSFSSLFVDRISFIFIEKVYRPPESNVTIGQSVERLPV